MQAGDVDGIRLVGFDGDDTLWRSQDFFDEAQDAFERIIGRYVDLADAKVHERLYEFEAANLALFGYGVKGMVLSMIEAAVAITRSRIGADDVHAIVRLGKALLRHPVELLPGIRDAVARIGQSYEVVLVTKGDLFHQEAKVRDSGLSDLFRRIEIVSEKDPVTYARVLAEFGLAPRNFVMVGNSVRSDILPVLQLGGWGVHVPYHTTWRHETQGAVAGGEPRVRLVADAAALPDAIAELAALAVSAAPPSSPGGLPSRD